ncbi:histone h2b [Vairimorpha apis BRL 01]|uniref:Histone h2b n=1 Tax=Vairimorpha apis BRL 01 TaxID=1037528 RepID=T0LA02_9MICR|nr:histone h2b [Vairimorpha apis BRL 01]
MNKAPKQSSGKAPINASQADTQKLKKKKKNSNLSSGMQFRSAIKRIAKDLSTDHSIFLTSQAIAVLCAIAYDIVCTVGETASEFSKKVNKQTVGADEVIAAFEILLKGELKKIALKEIHTTLAKQVAKSDIR